MYRENVARGDGIRIRGDKNSKGRKPSASQPLQIIIDVHIRPNQHHDFSFSTPPLQMAMCCFSHVFVSRLFDFGAFCFP
jgi:hypothetical protein